MISFCSTLVGVCCLFLLPYQPLFVCKKITCIRLQSSVRFVTVLSLGFFVVLELRNFHFVKFCEIEEPEIRFFFIFFLIQRKTGNLRCDPLTTGGGKGIRLVSVDTGGGHHHGCGPSSSSSRYHQTYTSNI